MKKSPLIGLLALGAAGAAEPDSIHYTLPTQKEVAQMCSAPNAPLCDPSSVEKLCATKKAQYKAELATMSEDELKATYDSTRETMLANWACEVKPLQPLVCTTDLSTFLKNDRDGNGEVTFEEQYGQLISQQLKILAGDHVVLKSTAGFDMHEAGADVMIRTLGEEFFCPSDSNKDGVISKKDDANKDGKITESDRKAF